MIVAAAMGACAVLAALAAFQVSLIAGAPLGRYAWGGQHVQLPPRLRRASAVALLLYALFALLILERAGLSAWSTHHRVTQGGMWALVAYLALGALMNALSRSKPERYLMTPVALVLAGLCAVVARG